MPLYEFRCAACGVLTTELFRIDDAPREIPCATCDRPAARIISRPSVHLSSRSKVEKLDPKYDKMVDRAIDSTRAADPDSYLKRMKPFPKDAS